MRIVKSDRDINKCESIACSQKDNVYRDGYVSIENQYNDFKRAGINRLEWLKKAYPQEKVQEHENALFSKEGVKAMIEAEKYLKGDELNILDGQIEAEKRLNLVNKEYENAKKECENALKNYENAKKDIDKKDASE